MEQAWENVMKRAGDWPHQKPMKVGWNAWIGTCGMRAMPQVNTKMSHDLADRPANYCAHPLGSAPRASECWLQASPPSDLPHVFTQLSPPALESGTYRPIYDWCLATEHVRLAQAHQAIQAVYKHIRLPFPALNIVTDSIIWERPRKKATAEALRALLESITIRCLPKLEDHIRQQRGQEEPKQKRLTTTDLYPMRGADSEARVYRVKAPHPNTHQSGMCKLP